MFCSQKEYQQLKSYVSQHSTHEPNDQGSITSILEIGADLIKKIQQENFFSLNLHSIQSNRQLNKKLHNYKRSNTQRPKRSNNSSQSNFQCSEDQDWISLNDYHNENNYQMPIFNFTQEIQKSQYVPIYAHKQNPQNFKKKKPEQIKTQNKKHINNTRQHKKLKQVQITPLKSPKNSKNADYISPSLLSTTKKFKKHILEAVQQKKKQQQNQQNSILLYNMQKNQNMNLKDFYVKNQQHVPIYQKAKQLQKSRIQKMQENKVKKQLNELIEVKFKPEICKNTERIVEGTCFQQRLEQSKIKKQKNQMKIIYQTLKDYPFAPKLNQDNLAQSKIKKIWNTQQKQDKQEQDESNSNFTYEYVDLAIRLSHNEANQLFQD